LVEFVLSRSSNSAIRFSKDWTNAEIAAWASVDNLLQMAVGSGGWSVMPSFYRPRAEEATTGFERLQTIERDALRLRAEADRIAARVEAKRAKIRQLTAELDTEREDLLLLYGDLKVAQANAERVEAIVKKNWAEPAPAAPATPGGKVIQ
jgi:hypothetical protein